jgi:chromate transport protein ChrA
MLGITTMSFSTNFPNSLSALRSLIQRRHLQNDDLQSSLSRNFLHVFVRTWDLGFTAFGGPAVHFQILHQRFVEGRRGQKWVDEQTVSSDILENISRLHPLTIRHVQYQELFAICQALPGPGSTKMLFCLVLLHAGFVPAVVTFLIWR